MMSRHDANFDLLGVGKAVDIDDVTPEALAEHFALPDRATQIEIAHGGLTSITVDSKRDVFVVMMDEHLEPGEKAALRAMIQQQFGVLRVLILDGGWKLGVVRVTDPADPDPCPDLPESENQGGP